MKKSVGPALETRQSHTIEYGVSKIVPEGSISLSINTSRNVGSSDAVKKQLTFMQNNKNHFGQILFLNSIRYVEALYH